MVSRSFKGMGLVMMVVWTTDGGDTMMLGMGNICIPD